MSKKLILFLSGVFLFFTFIGFSYLVHRDLFLQMDFNTTVRLQDNISRRLDDNFSWLSEIGKFEVMTVVLFVVFVLTRKILAGLVGFSLYVGFHLIELYGKFFVDHAPPPQFMLRTKHFVDLPQFHVRAENSYPSGHSGRALFLSAILIVLIWQSKKLNKITKIFLTGALAGYDIAMLVSRIYLGEHWTTDVVGGAILGLGLGLVSSSLLVKKSTAA